MDEHTVTVYCLCDYLLRALHHHEDAQCPVSDAEVLTTAIVAATEFCGNFEKARQHLSTAHDTPTMLSKSCFNQRLHRIRDL